MSQGRELRCQVVMAGVGSSDSPLSHLQWPLGHPPPTCSRLSDLGWRGGSQEVSTESKAWGTTKQPLTPQATPEEVSQVLQLSCPHHIRWPLTLTLPRPQPQNLDP